MTVEVKIGCDVCGAVIYHGSQPTFVSGGAQSPIEAIPPSGARNGRVTMTEIGNGSRPGGNASTTKQTCSEACTEKAARQAVADVFAPNTDRRGASIVVEFGLVQGRKGTP